MPHARIQNGSAFLHSITRKTLVLAAALAVAFSVLVGSSPQAEASSTGLISLRNAVVHLTNVQRAVKGCKPLRCTLSAFGTSSLDYQLVLELKSIDPDKLARDRQEVMLALINRFAAEGIAFAYPVQIGYSAAPDGKFVMPYADPA